MSKLVDKERLAKLAQALDSRMKAAVKAEKERAMGVEQSINSQALQNKAAIEAINDVNTGILAQAKNHCDSVKAELSPKINSKVEQEEYNAKVTELVSKDKEMAADILGLDTAVKAIEGKMGDGNLNLPAIDKAITDFKAEQKQVDNAQDAKVANLEEAVFGKEGGKAGLEKEMDAAEARIKNLEDADFDGKISKEETDRKAADEKLAGDITALDARVVANENFVKDHSHEDIEGRLYDLEALFKGDESVDSKIDAVHQEVVALESKHDLAVQAQATKDQQQNEAIAAKVAKADYNAKMEALDAEDERIAGLVATEEQRADAAEKALGQRIDAVLNAENGLLKQAKDYADQEVKKEADARAEAEEVINGKIEDIEEAAGLLEGRVSANEAKLAGLEKNTVQAAINQAEADAKAHAEQKIAELVDSAPEAMDTLNELAKAIKDNEDIYKTYVEQHAKDCQDAADAAEAAAIADAAAKDAALKTELQKEIDDDVKVEKERAMAEEADIRADFATADAKVLEDAAADAAAKVAVEKGRAEGQEAAIRQEMADEAARVNKKIADDIATESALRVEEEQAIRTDFAAADSVLDGRIKTLEGLVVGGEGEGLEAVIADVAQNKQDIVDLKAADATLQANIDAKVAQADYDVKVKELEDADKALDNRVKVFEAGGAQDVAAKEVRLADAEQAIEDLKEFVAGHSHAQMIADIDANNKAIAKEVQDRKDAVAKEVQDRDAAIAEALKDYTDTKEMKVMLGNIINSLAVVMEDNKMVLKLGGVEGVAIHEASLDMATDDDIDAIIKGLDA